MRNILSDIVTVSRARNLQEARALINDARFDMALVDFTLPDGSGSEIIIEMAKLKPDMPIIVFSAHEIADNIRHVEAVFLKGRFKEKELHHAVRRLCYGSP